MWRSLKLKFSPSFVNWLSRQNENYLVMGLVTFTFPYFFIKGIYENNRGLYSWNGNKSCLTISFDCDYPEDVEAIPALLKTLDRYSFKTSFACVGHWIEKYPREHKMILDHGHEIMNHTYSHPDNELLNPGRKFKLISREEKLEEVEKCHDICRKILKYEPKGCRIPHFKNLFTPEIYGILKELGYSYSSSTWLTNTTTFGMPFLSQDGIYEFPLSTCPSHPFTVFDTWHSLNTPRWSHRILHRGPESYCDLFLKLLDLGRETGSYLNIYIDPLDIKKIGRFEAILESLAADYWVATYEELVTYMQKQEPKRMV